MKCPRCGGENCQYITASETHSKFFSSGNACCGLLLLGPAGLLCGLCGSRSDTEVKEYWVCHDCGNKFNANLGGLIEDKRGNVSQLINSKYKVRFYQDVFGSSVLQKNELWNQVQEGYEKYIQGSVLEPYYLQHMPNEVSKVYVRIEKNCVRELKQNVDIPLAIIEDRGLLLTPKGLFINDCFISNMSLESILLCRNIIFVNRIAFELYTDQEADILFEFLTFLYPQIISGKESHMEKAVEKLHRVKNESRSSRSASYFSKNQQYKDYVAQMTADYVECYLELNPEIPYDEYLKVKERQQLLMKIMIGGQAVLAVLLFIIVGIPGLLISAGIFAGFYIWIWKEAWRKPFARLLPEEMEKLLRENDEHLGRLSLEKYKYIIERMKEQLIKTKCKYCGQFINPDKEFCSFCGKKIQNAMITESKKCKKCGNELKEDDVFCMKCGSKIIQ